MYLADLAKGRDNNLTLLRIIAATAVLFSHSFVLATGDAATEPLRNWIGMTTGSIAVDIFFVVSGFLVTASISKSQDVLDFVVARCLRIFPALLVMLLITVFILGPLVTTVPMAQYFGRETLLYFLKCATLVKEIAFQLPGVFATNPYRDAVNGSLWTMAWEVRSYIVLVLVWWFSFSIVKWKERGFLALTCLNALLLWGVVQFLHLKDLPSVHSAMPLLMFTLGAAMWQLRQRLLLNWPGFAVAAALLCVTPFVSVDAFYLVYPFAMAYAVMFLAFVPGGPLRRYNRMGDYSYGTYVYAFPIQQLLAQAWHGITPVQMIFASFAATIVCAVLSWHLIEERSLGMKAELLARLRSLRSRLVSA